LSNLSLTFAWAITYLTSLVLFLPLLQFFVRDRQKFANYSIDFLKFRFLIIMFHSLSLSKALLKASISAACSFRYLVNFSKKLRLTWNSICSTLCRNGSAAVSN
jgi:hypothetical protein